MWKWIAGPASGGHDSELTVAQNRRVTFRLSAPSDTSCELDGTSEQAATIADLATDLHVLRDGVVLGRFRVGATQDTLDVDSHKMTLTGMDYRAVLARRMLWDDTIASLVFSSPTDQAQIAWAMVADTQARPGGDLGISPGVGHTTGVLRTRQDYKAGQFIGPNIDNLSNVIGGFDWDITASGQSALAFDVWFPGRGSDRGLVLDRMANPNGGGAWSTGTRVPDPSKYANAVRYSGADTTTPQKREAADLASRPEGRWDGQFGDPTVTLQSTVDEYADGQLNASQTIVPVWTVTLTAGWWQGPSHLWLGDTVQLVCMSGRLATNEFLRVFEIECTVDDSGAETVKVTLGAPALLDPDRILLQQVAALRDLRRR